MPGEMPMSSKDIHPVTPPLEGIAKSAMTGAWLGEANNNAAQLGVERPIQAEKIAQIGNFGERLKKLNPSSKVLEKSLRFDEKQARKREAKAGWKDVWAGKADRKAGKLTNAAESQLAKKGLLEEKISRRVTSAEVARNAQQKMVEEAAKIKAEYGVTVNIKSTEGDGNWFTRWFDRTVTDRIDKMRTAHNERLSAWNSKRSEGQINKADGYKEAAFDLRAGAAALRVEMEASRERYAARVAERQGKLLTGQEAAAQELAFSSDRANEANSRLQFSREVLPGMGQQAAEQMTGVTSLNKDAAIAKQFVKDASEGLAGAGQQGTK